MWQLLKVVANPCLLYDRHKILFHTAASTQKDKETPAQDFGTICYGQKKILFFATVNQTTLIFEVALSGNLQMRILHFF